MTDWTPQDDWSQVKVGDQVRAMRAEQMLTGKVVDRYIRGSATGGEVYSLILEVEGVANQPTLDRAYWQLSVPAKPAVVLPTEEGIYMDVSGSPWELRFFFEAVMWKFGGDLQTDSQAELYAPFTRLEPVAVTAKKVIEFIESDLSCDSYDTARKEFGVSDD